MSTVKNTQDKQSQFSGLRAALWPIHTYELKKFLPLGFIMFCILFNYTLLRDTKDTLVVNAAGASALTFLKLYCVTPAAVLFVIGYSKLTNILSRENVFYAVITPFLVFFGLFGFVIYPNLDLLHPSAESIASLQAAYPHFSGFIDIYAYWAYSLFYVLAEIWGSAMIALMFWQFANYVVTIKESKRFYGLFAVIANVALIFSGQAVVFFSKNIQQYYASKEIAWQVSLYWLMGFVVFFGILTMAIYRWMYVSVLSDKRYFDPELHDNSGKKKKEKPSLMESFRLILRSPELRFIAILIMAYGVTINLVEVQFKGQLKLFYEGDKGGYNAFMGWFSTLTGILTIIFGLTIGSNILRRVSWFKAAVITPLVMTVGGVLFFLFIFSQEIAAYVLNNFSLTAVAAASFLGAAIVVISKAVKYVLFDSTKEMAYIPLNDELKTKGKAAVDVIGGRAGKAGGSLVQNVLFLILATKDVVVVAPYAFLIFLVVCGLWLLAVKGLSKRVEIDVKNREIQDKEIEKAKKI